jgi:CheY-like chemotaxis protein
MLIEMSPCRCCEEAQPGWELTARPLRRYRAWRPGESRAGEAVAICEGCARWLAGLVLEARSDGGGRLFGQPGSGGRQPVFDDQCAACYETPGLRAFAVRWVAGGAVAGDLFLCPGCARWLLGLANSGRTVRGRGERHLDGAYGNWPHPRLRGLRVWSRVRDRGTREVIATAITAMELETVAVPGEADVLLVEAAGSGRARTLTAELGAAAGRVIVLAGLRSREDVVEALARGAFGWVTLPVTPQQLTGALARMVRQGGPVPWDGATGLPVLEASAIDRPWLWLPIEPGEDAWEAAWLARRFSRGYDTVGAAEGGIGIVPVVPPGAIGRVLERMQGVLGGRRVELRMAGGRPQRRFEAAG